MLFDCCGYLNLFFPNHFFYLSFTLLEAQELGLDRIGGDGGGGGGRSKGCNGGMNIGRRCCRTGMQNVARAHFYF